MRVRAGDGAGLALALFGYPLAVNLLLGGPARMWGWVRAKWVNQPYAEGPGAGRPAPAFYPTPTGKAPPKTLTQRLTTTGG